MTSTSFPAVSDAQDGCVPGLVVSVLDTVGLACAVVERGTQRVVWMSDGLRRLSGLQHEDVADLPVGCTLLDATSAAFAMTCCATGLDDPGAFTFAGTLTAADGPVPVAWTISSLAEEDAGRHVLLVAVDQRSDAARSVVFSHVAANGAGISVLGADLDGRVTFCSPSMEALLGRHADDLLGRPLPLELFDEAQLERRAELASSEVGPELLLLHHPEWDDATGGYADVKGQPGDDELANCRSRRGTGEGTRTDWNVRRADGTDLTVSLMVQEVSDTSDQPVGYLAWALDVTEERRTRDLLVSALEKERMAAERLAQLDATRNDFVATASHELRTPVTSIRGYAELMADGDGTLSPRDAMFVEAILRNADRLCALSDDLLVLSSMDANPEALVRAPLDLRDVVDSCAIATRGRGLSHDLEVRVDGPASPVVVEGDAEALRRVVDHLLANAVKFTEAGTITCAVRTEGDRAVVEVADTGIGIAPDEQSGIFTRFYRTSDAHRRAVPGSGLGLSVARTLVAAHGGEISLASRPEVGTTVTVRLPLAPGERS